MNDRVDLLNKDILGIDAQIVTGKSSSKSDEMMFGSSIKV